MNTKIVLPIIGALVIGLILGIFIGKYIPTTSKVSTNNQPGSSQESFFNQQTAQVIGKIDSVNGNTLNFKNKQGQSGSLGLDSNVIVYRPGISGKPASASADIKAAPIGQDVVVNLIMRNGNYVVVSISEIPPAPTNQPKDSNSSKAIIP